ncbi:MAG: polymer-forming cytoskeletal protein [Candidatus Electryoneaceae bacterium]|nr:polymer-forming cytoskeletal protein [Candidatus Electryoneaceae bacterium]
MSRKNSSHSGGELSTIIGSDAKLEGSLTVKHSARVDGKVNGTIESSGSITVGPEGIVEGDIIAENVMLGGKVIGQVTAKGRIVIEGSAVLTGNLKTVNLVIQEGATFNGSSDMGGLREAKPDRTPQITLSDEE